MTALISLQVHRILLESIKQVLEAIQHDDTPGPAYTEQLYQRLLHAIRALKSVYVATVTFVDPYGARAAMQELVLSSAQAKTRALGLSIPTTPARSPAKLSTTVTLKHASLPAHVSSDNTIEAYARQMFLVSIEIVEPLRKHMADRCCVLNQTSPMMPISFYTPYDCSVKTLRSHSALVQSYNIHSNLYCTCAIC